MCYLWLCLCFLPLSTFVLLSVASLSASTVLPSTIFRRSRKGVLTQPYTVFRCLVCYSSSMLSSLHEDWYSIEAALLSKRADSAEQCPSINFRSTISVRARRYPRRNAGSEVRVRDLKESAKQSITISSNSQVSNNPRSTRAKDDREVTSKTPGEILLEDDKSIDRGLSADRCNA
jgi:hypothetical protein